MYHYVRESDVDMPYFRYLSVENFQKQLDYFEEEYGIVTYNEFKEYIEGKIDFSQLDGKVVLTFDDGFIDHYIVVLPELMKRGILGIFYVPTGVHKRKKALDVHRIHYLLGKYGGQVMMEALKEIITDEVIDKSHYNEFIHHTYLDQVNDAATDEFKKIFNYYIAYEHRENILDRLVQKFSNDTEIFNNIYMSMEQLKALKEANMVIGSHSVNHFVMSKLSVEEQSYEIVDSFEFIEKNLGKQAIKTFCYPYGGFHTFSEETEKLLNKIQCDFSFNVENRDVTMTDFRTRPQALPRHDCNVFPHGKANLG